VLVSGVGVPVEVGGGPVLAAAEQGRDEGGPEPRAPRPEQFCGRRARIFVLDLTTLALTQLTDYPGEPNAVDSAPAWVGSANLAFSSTTGGADQVYVLPADSV
jgi:hypothetical protein